MSDRSITVLLFVVYTVLVAALGAFAYRTLTDRSATVHERPAPAAREADGGLTLEKRTGTAGAPDVGVVPAGHKPVRVATVTVAPSAAPVPTDATPAECRDAAATMACPPVTTVLAVSQANDGTLRITAKSPDGEVTGGMDYALGDLKVRDASHKWAFGLSAPAQDFESVGFVVQRDIWKRLRIGADVYRVDPGISGVPPIPAVPGLYAGHPGIPAIEPFLHARAFIAFRCC